MWPREAFAPYTPEIATRSINMSEQHNVSEPCNVSEQYNASTSVCITNTQHKGLQTWKTRSLTG